MKLTEQVKGYAVKRFDAFGIVETLYAVHDDGKISSSGEIQQDRYFDCAWRTWHPVNVLPAKAKFIGTYAMDIR